mmetsp:Transcript_45614/g.177528  ORF Transcript_45614/g.177528 Transcript_45614/m.177528 type:complete len:94 (+) Transcript_45614:99-380(+)
MAKRGLQNFLLILLACVIGRVAQWLSSLDGQVLSVVQVAHLHGDESRGGFVLLNGRYGDGFPRDGGEPLNDAFTFCFVKKANISSAKRSRWCT